MDIKKRILRFGNLEDIIFVEKTEIQSLQAKLNSMLTQECNGLKKCPFRDDATGCNLCKFEKKCREDSKKNFEKMNVIEKKMFRTLFKLKFLLWELFSKQQEESKRF